MDDEVVRRFRRQLKLLHRRLRQEFVPPASGMSLSEMQVLIVVVRSDSITPRGIADELRMTSSNVAAALRVLESSGLVVRAKDPHDGRQVNLSATPNATALMARFRNERDTWLGRAISTQLTAEELTVLARAGELMERLAHFEAPPDNR